MLARTKRVQMTDVTDQASILAPEDKVTSTCTKAQSLPRIINARDPAYGADLAQSSWHVARRHWFIIVFQIENSDSIFT